MRSAGNTHRTCRLVAQFGQHIQLGLDLIEAVADGVEQALSGCRGGYAAGGAGEQADLHPVFQAADGLAQGGLGHPQPRRRAGKVALARHGDKGVQIVEIALHDPLIYKRDL